MNSHGAAVYAISAVAILSLTTPAPAKIADPLGYRDDLSFHSYVGNDPANKTDPTGLCQTASRIPGAGGDQPCQGETVGLSSASHNRAVAQKHPKEYRAMTAAYKENFGKDFNPFNSAAHVSDTTDDTCAKSSSCTRASVFGGLSHCPTPSGCSLSAFKSGDTTFAAPVGMVKVETDPNNYWLMNITIPSEHLLNPGVVLRESVDRGADIGVLSMSIGAGRFRDLNNQLTPFVWGIANFQLQEYLLYRRALGQ